MCELASGLGRVDTTGVELQENNEPERMYPWGHEFDSNLANTEEGRINAICAVGCFSAGTSPYGVRDMSGNTWEWTRSHYRDYPYVPMNGRENVKASDRISRVVRGGSFSGGKWYARCAFRNRFFPDARDICIGFRVVISPLRQ